MLDQEIYDLLNFDNVEGQIFISDSKLYFDPEIFPNPPIPTMGGLFLKDILLEGLSGEIEVKGSSVIQDCFFNKLTGSISSAISVKNSALLIQSSIDVKEFDIAHFNDNASSEGSTIYSVSSTVLLRSIRMSHNYSSKGGSIYAVNSELDAYHSVFEKNTAKLGGVVFAISKSAMKIRDSILRNNRAVDGGVLYGLSNTVDFATQKTLKYIRINKPDGTQHPAISFQDSVIRDNWSRANLIHILLSSMQISNTTLVDNYC